MNIVISDSTALILFAKSNTLHFLSNLFEKIYIPQAVHDELNFKDDIVKYRINEFDKISIKPVSDSLLLSKIAKLNIDKGEIEAITLALELDLLLIIDEKKGRKIALNQGLKIVGILGILIENYKQNFITYEKSHFYFKLLKNNGLRVSDELEEIFYKKLVTIQHTNQIHKKHI